MISVYVKIIAYLTISHLTPNPFIGVGLPKRVQFAKLYCHGEYKGVAVVKCNFRVVNVLLKV